MLKSRAARIALPLVLGLTVGLMATTSAANATTRTAAATSAHKATGTPIKVGFYSDGESAAADNTSEIAAARAGVHYVNNTLGGAHGHPIDLIVCQGNQTPAAATNCGDQLVSDKVVAILNNATSFAAPLDAAVAPSGIPLVYYGSTDPSALNGGTFFSMVDLLGQNLAGPAELAKKAGLTKLTMIVLDVPTITDGITTYGTKYYAKSGIKETTVAVPFGTADLTPQVQTALSSGAQAFGIIGLTDFCTSALQAMRTLGFKGPVYMGTICLGSNPATQAASISGGLQNVDIISTENLNSKSADVTAYKTLLKAESPNVQTSGLTPGGFAVVVGFARALSAASSISSPADVEAALKAMKPAPIPLGSGLTFQCNDKQVSYAPGQCSTSVLVAKMNAQGAIGPFKQLSLSGIEGAS